MFVRDVTDPEIAEQQAALAGRRDRDGGLMEMEPPETRAGMARRRLEQIAEMVVGGWYALADGGSGTRTFPARVDRPRC